MKNKRLYMMLSVLALAIGFATVSTVLYINGTTGIATNDESFRRGIIFTNASTDEGGSVIIEQEGRVLTYTSKVLVQKDDETELNYEISNLDKNYDASAKMSCKFIDEELNESETNELVEITYEKNAFNILSGAKVNGTINVKLIHNAEVATEIGIKCTVLATAIERTSAGSVALQNTNSFNGIITDESENPLTGGYLAVFSEKKVYEIGTDGSVNLEGLEPGIHEVYLMESDPTTLEKSEIESQAIASGLMAYSTTATTLELKKGETVYYINKKEAVNLYTLIKENTKGVLPTTFSVNSNTGNTNGIYTTTSAESDETVYYYRGNVDNNIIFGGFCWKIIRTTEAGGVKLIYNGTPKEENGKEVCKPTADETQVGSLAWNSAYNDNAYVGYMYGTPGSSTYELTHENKNNSEIKTYIEGNDTTDGWFKTSGLIKYQDKLEDTVFCNDRSTKAYDANLIGSTSYSSYGALGYGTNATLYGAAHRAWYYTKTPSPSLVCSNTNDKFTVNSANGNGALTNPVGLITSDEVILAGYNTYASNSSDYQNTTNYLHTGQSYWTFSPVRMDTNGYAYVGIVYSPGYVSNDYVDHTHGVRPVVSLKPGIKVRGNGIPTNPYVVV